MKKSKIIKRYIWDGQITIFTLMVFMMIVILLISQYKSALYYACRTDARQAAYLSADGFLSAYQKVLRDRYEILAVDGGYGQEVFLQDVIEDQLLWVFERNMQSSLTKNQVGNFGLAQEPVFTFLIDGDWDFFLREIDLNRKNNLIQESMDYIVGQWQKQNDVAEKEFSKKRQEAEDAKEELIQNTEEELEQTNQNIQDPRDLVMNIWNQGILKAACPEDFSVSEKTTIMSDVSYPEAAEQVGVQIDFKSESSIQNLLSNWKNVLKPEVVVNVLKNEWAVQSYTKDKFQNAVAQNKNQENEQSVLEYEMEYIIGGHDTDSENLKTVLWKLLAIRCVFNLAYLMSSVEKGNQVMITATMLSTALLIPYFTEVIAFGLKIVWAFAESLADCRTLLNGGKIPLTKNDGSWYLTWDAMLGLHAGILDGNSSEEGIDYTSYLQILLSFVNRDTKYRRMTHLMEKNIRLIPEYSGFKMKNCVYGIQAVYSYELKSFGQYEVQTALSY